MVFGLNFNSTHIPPGWKRKFRDRVKIEWLTLRGSYYHLVGVATTKDDMHHMLIQANNGHRLLHVEERQAASGKCYGIYAY